jgi:hypothetical protein
VEANQSIQEQIAHNIAEFWDKRIVPARRVWNDPNLTEQEKMLTVYSEYEPDIDPNAQDSLQDFLNLRFKEISKQGKLMVTPDIQTYLDKYGEFRAVETTAAGSKSQYGNEIRSALIAHQCDEITSADGRILASYRLQADGKLILRVK